MYNLPQKLFTEFIGTFAIIFIGIGAICGDQYLRLTGQGGAGLLGIAAAQGLAVAVIFTAIGHISGGHFNPAITVGIWVTRRIGTFQALFYCVAQLLAAIAAAYAIKMILPETAWSAPAYLGATGLAADFSRANGIALEALATFFLVLVFFATAVDAKGVFNKAAGFAIGLTVTVDVLFAGPFTGAAMNPARAFGPALALPHWQNQGVYWVGPLLGGVVAGFLYDRCFLGDQPAL